MHMLNNIRDAINWIEKQIKFKPKTDLDRMKQAYQLLGLNLDGIKKIHVAGTNGKGSVCAYLTHILLEAGYKVGTYTSPYLVRFNERIRINFIEIPDDELLELIQKIYDFNMTFEKTYGEFLSFFELLTLMSMIHFKNQEVDCIVMEVGLGGLLDATNVLNYDLSLITSIGFDHMKQLGNTLESIAYNKLGIVKPYHHLITTVDPSLHPQFVKHCIDHQATFELYTKKNFKVISDFPVKIMVDHVIYELSLLGDYQHLNALLAIKAIHYLFPKISTHKIQQGLKKTTWAGRLEEIAP
ncbi:MAG: bifunctional folylpolyglutamate synthase/dihydrofolate synthase, partial [Bacillota bacterium]